MKIAIRRTMLMLLMFIMVIAFIPNLGAASKVYAAESISGNLNASDLTLGGEYTLSDDTTIYIDDSVIIRSIDVKEYTLTIEGNGEDILSIYGTGITGYQGNVVLNSGKLDFDTDAGSGSWIGAIYLTLGGFTMNGGGLFMNYSANGVNASYGICAASFTMNGGTATITCTTSTSGSAVGIQTNDFTMTDGDLSVTAETTVSGESADGIAANGSTSDSDFHMSGGTLSAQGIADSQGYGIDWTADRTKNSFVIDGGKITAEGTYHGICSWVPVMISGGADVTARSTNSSALYTSEGTISIRGIGTKVTANSANGDAIAAYKSTIELASGVEITQPENGYVAIYGGDSQAIKDASDNWAKQAVIEGVSREEITQIIATSDITTPVYGEPIPYPEITVESGSPAYFRDAEWYKKTDSDWEEVSGGTFTEGTYHCSAMIRIDQGGTEYVLGWPITVTVDGVEWTSGWSKPEVYATYSRLGIGSPEYVVTAPLDAPLAFNDKSSYDIGTTYIGEAISDFSVASSAEGGKTPYVFSKTSGPDWISVSSDGVVSGTPSAVGTNEDLVVRVTDDEGDYKEITISVAPTVINPADRAVITEIIAKSNITTPEYGAEIPDPVITVQYGAPAYFSSASWYKKNGDTWEEVTEDTFSEGTYHCSAMIRIDEGGTEYILGWPLKVTVDGTMWTSGWVDGPEVYDTYSRLGIGSPDYVVEQCPSGGAHDWHIVNHKASFTVDGYQCMECSKCGKRHDDGIAIGALKVKTAKLEKSSYVYTGKPIKPAVTLASADGPLNKDYYTVTYSNNTKAGTATAKIELKGDYYEGTKSLTFKIVKPTITLSKSSYTYDGKVKKPTVTVKVGTTKLTTKSYTATYASGRKKVGKYSVKITFKGNYEGTKTVYFKILPKKPVISDVTMGTAKMTVKMKTKVSSTGGTYYQIKYRVKGTTKWTTKDTKNQSLTIKSLKKGKAYQVKVRAYKTVSGTKYYSAWSSIKTTDKVK